MESGCGMEENPLQLSWISGNPSVSRGENSRVRPTPKSQTPPTRTLEDDRDYETLTLMRLRQAQERKRLAEQLQEEDERSVDTESF